MPYPDINKRKDDKWLLDYARMAWNDGNKGTSIFYNNIGHYELIKRYVMGRQDVGAQMKSFVNDRGESWLDIDRRPRPIVAKFRDKAIAKIMQRQFNILATPIDPLAKDDADKYFADVKAKILMRDQLRKVNPELADSPVLQKQPNEPENLEELEMKMNYGWKHNMAIEAEEGWMLIAYQNDFEEERKITTTNLYDYGVGGYKEWLDKGQVKLRAVNPANIITNFCRYADFRDLCHVGEVIEVDYADLPFSDEQKEIIRSNANMRSDFQPGQASVSNRDKTKVGVLDLELLSYDDIVYSQMEDKRKNYRFGRTDKSKLPSKYSDMTVDINGKLQPAYIMRNVRYVYKVKWIIGTDFVYDTGLVKNQKRDKSKLANTSLSYHLYAYNFHEMRAQGIMERLIPIIDEYQLTMFKIQQFKNDWIPYIINIDLDALEEVALSGKQEENMTPLELLDFMFQKKVMLGRRKDNAGNPNYKAVEVEATPMANEFMVLLNDLTRLLGEMSDICGFNELTDGSTPNPKTLVPVANSAIEATNNALYPIIYANKKLLQRLARGVIQRLQIAVKQGDVSGVVHALGSETVKFIQVSPDLPLYSFGIMIEDKPNDDEKQMLLEKLNMKDAQGLIDPEDYVMVMNTNNLKVAQQMLAYKVKKRREQDQQYAMAQQQQNGQIQIQSAQAAEEEKRKTTDNEYKWKIELENVKGEWMLKAAGLKTDATVKASENSADAKIVTSGMQHHSAERQAKIKQGIPVESMDDTPMDAITDPNQNPALDQQPPVDQSQQMPQPGMGQPPM